MVSDQQVKKEFLSMEADAALFSFAIDDVSLYFILRYHIEEIYRTKVSQQRNWLSNSIFTAKKIIKDLLTFFIVKPAQKQPMAKEEKSISSPFLFVSTSDWTITEGESIELVDIIKYYRKLGIQIHFVQPDFNNNKIVKQLYHDGFTQMRTAVPKPFDPAVVQEVKRFLSFVSGKLQTNFESHLESCIVTVVYSLSMAKQLAGIIKAANARMVFARSLYTEPWIAIACSRTNAICVEVQHGVVSPDNIYYQTANATQLDSRMLFPDYMLTLGKRWTEILINYHQQYDSTNAFTLGIKEMPSRKTNPRKYTVLICLQPGIFDISPLIIKLCSQYKEVFVKENIKLLIRPHPNSVQSTLREFSAYINEEYLQIENSRQVEFYKNLEESDMLVSLSSMCLYEALSIGIPVISFEYSKGITIPEGIMFVNNEQELMKLIIELKQQQGTENILEYLSPFDGSTLDNLLELSSQPLNNGIGRNFTGSTATAS